MKIINYYSPNFDKKSRPLGSIKAIIIHYTGMQSERESITRLCDINSKVSSHYVINRTGKVYRLVADNKIAWHAGVSCWGNLKSLNKSSIGIELVNKGHNFGYNNYKKKQINSLIKVCKTLIKKYHIKKKNVVGHSDIAPLRKNDPGEKFPWRQLAKNKIGLWHDYNPKILSKYRKINICNKNEKVRFAKNLNKIGFCNLSKKKLLFRKILKAFQRHYRKELINGHLDKECYIIAENLSKKIQ
tara:strand:+ start:573 stop:1301 length:729 start_codon:yes stop_codon:yes gene_type:complete